MTVTERLEQRDTDVCLLVVEFDAGQLRTVRHEVSRQLSRAGLPDGRAQDFLVAVSEAMSNAVRHGAGSGRISLWRDGRVVCEVTDQGDGFAAGTPRLPVPPPGITQSSGRGLWLAQEFTDSMAIDSGPDGTRVQLSKRLPTDDPDEADRTG